MTSSRPYIVRALYEWILENNCTPYILVNAYANGVEVPQEHVKDGQIILNISPGAVQGLTIGNKVMEFNGRFAGIPKRVYVPAGAIMGIYAKENGQGMIFDKEVPAPEPPHTPGDNPPRGTSAARKSDKTRPSLRVVK
ncbi:MAG: ClpXP protease specificity-enhancing factor [Pseudohongiellaceae bacterium]